MKADALSFGRATTVCLVGLALQLTMSAALVVYGTVTRDHAATSAGYLVGLGLIAWAALAIVFDQHRRERLEALEAESLAGIGGRAASVFEGQADDLRVAARRLGWMHRVLMPMVSIALAGALIGVGVTRFGSGEGLVEPDKFTAPPERGWAIALGLGCAVIGFVFARFVAGMAKQAVWSNLRAGSGYAVAAALLGLSMPVAHVVHLAGADWLLRYLQVAVPALGVLLGAEILLNLLFGLYRPRKAGETPRPAFDSRVLAFVASPDRLAESLGGAINYQFGVDVSSTWAYQLLSRSALLLGVVVAAVIWALTGVEIVGPNERAIRVRMGADAGEVGPGMYLKLPWPLEVFQTETTTTARSVDLKTLPPANVGPILWTNEHKVEEIYAIVRPTVLGPGAGGGGGAGAGSAGSGEGGAVAGASRDVALVAVEIPLVYTVSDWAKFHALAQPASREGLVKAAARREALSFLSGLTEDELLSARRAEASAELRRRVQSRLDAMNAGVRVISCAVEGVHPEKDAARTFEKVVENEQKGAGEVERALTVAIRTLTEAVGSVDLAREIAREIDALTRMRDRAAAAAAGGAEAEAEAGGVGGRDPDAAAAAEIAAQEARIEALIARAGGKAAEMLAEARAQRWERHMLERGRAEAFQGQLAAYRAAPELYRAQLYFQALREAMKDTRVFITSDDVPDLRIETDVKDLSTGGDILAAPKMEP